MVYLGITSCVYYTTVSIVQDRDLHLSLTDAHKHPGYESTQWILNVDLLSEEELSKQAVLRVNINIILFGKKKEMTLKL